MARCDQGYLCRVCGHEVEQITDSELYLRFVIGEIDPEHLHLLPDCHLRCSPSMSQFIDDPRFGSPVELKGPFSLENLDAEFVVQKRALVNRGYQRLWEIKQLGRNSIPIHDYPLPERTMRWR